MPAHDEPTPAGDADARDPMAPITFIVPGTREAGAAALRPGAAVTRGAADDAGPAAQALPGTVKASVRVAALRAAGEAQRLVAVPGEDVVALHIAGGPVLMLHPANARDLMLAMAEPNTLRGTADAAESRAADEVAVVPQLRWRALEQAGGPTVTRGFLGDVVLGAFEILTGFGKDKVIDAAAAFAASAVVKKVDGQVEAGVYRLVRERLDKLKGSGRRVDAIEPAVAAAGPLLVFIHGTFVETTSTFGKLWAHHPASVRQLFDAYRDRVYALDHETLGQSPIHNALTLVQALPEGARLHLVTHSRGGLVAEVLARMAHQRGASAADLDFFPGAEHEKHRAELKALAAECAKRRITVERVVRVACPARGTLLAARRLDAYLSVLKWTIESTGVPLAGDVLDFIAEVARQRAEPEMIPGLAAMIPDTPLVNWLNGSGEAIPGDLRVIAGDLEGDSIGSWLKTLLADAYYWTDNDIVVHTRSMYAGAPRTGGASFMLDRGGKTTHFAYFQNPQTVEAVVAGLLEARPDRYAPIGLLSWQGRDAGGLRGSSEPDPTKPAVFVLPGILGSNLKAGGHRVWLAARLVGGLDRLEYRDVDDDGVEPDGAISVVYDALQEHLARSHEVVEFAFDWRRPIEDEAARLAQALERALDARAATGQPVRLLAHSMGGLVARTVQIVAPDTWTRLMQHPGARLVMLGTPNGGSWAPMQVLSGDDTMGNALAAFGSPLSDRAARRIMAGMPGFLQLQAGLLDRELELDDEATWRRLADDDVQRVQKANWWHRHAGETMEAAYHWGVPPQGVLDQAKALREKLDAQVERDLPRFAAKLKLVIGQAKATPVGFEAGPAGFVYLDAADGDGRVPLASALLPGVETWTLDVGHGGLPSEKRAFDAFAELLEAGTTARLRRFEPAPVLRGEAPGARRGLTKSRPSRARQTTRPAEQPAAVFDAARAAADEARSVEGGALRIRVINGNLAFIGEPLLVGHYASTELTGTEAVIDRLIGGTMGQALAVGRYPEAIGTSQVFVNGQHVRGNPFAPPRPHAAIVAGLGDEGGLRESDLVKAVQQAVIAWSQRLAEDAERAGAVTTLAATLLGSGGLGVSPAGAARAIARGVRQANVGLAAIGWPVVSELHLIELYLDRASDAWNGLRVLADASPESYGVADEIRFGTGPLRRQPGAGYRGADYDLISATAKAEGTIEFALDSRRARTEVRAQRTQAALVQQLVARGATAQGSDPALGRTLFQLLVPVEIEPFLGGNDRMVLDLDERTAAIPWELLDAGSEGGGSDRRPWAIRAQVLRRLRRTSPIEAREARRDTRADDAVLVIGEPRLDPGAPYAPLPGAKEEAEIVQQVLLEQGGMDFERITSLADEPDGASVISALLARPWRIVHIAGHGESPAAGNKAAAERGQPQRGSRGVVLSDGLFLGPDEIGCMRAVPELVFVNCCHLAAYAGPKALAAPDPAGFAAGVAVKLIDMGVRCVVAAGWAVEDGPAHEFARRFYRELLRGARFIDAVAAAREAAWLANPTGKSWAAYQCYGDPNWVYRERTGDAQLPSARVDETAAIASPVGLALALDTIATETRHMGRDPAAQQERLSQLDARFGARWGGIGAVAEAFGVAWAATGDNRQAVAWLRRAIGATDGSASHRAEEQLLNLDARSAARATKERGLTPDEARRRIEDAAARIGKLAEQRPTQEVLSILGSTYKRLAMVERGAGRPKEEQAALRRSAAAYRRGYALAAEGGSLDRFYPGFNAWALSLCLEDAAEGLEAAQLDDAVAAQQERARTDPDFWSVVAGIEHAMLRAIAGQELARHAEALRDEFARVHRRHAAVNDWASVADQADLVLGSHARRSRGAERDAARALMAQLAALARRGPENAAA